MKNKITNFLNNHYILFLNLYLISIFLRSSTLIIDYPRLDIIGKALRIVAFVFMIARCIVILPDLLNVISISKWKEKKSKERILLIIILILFIAVVINTIKIRSIRLLSICLVIISSYNMKLEKILKDILIVQLTMTFIIITCTITGITQDFTISRLKDTIVRHSLGFSYPTNLSQIILFTSLTYMYLKKFKIGWAEILILEILNIYTFYITDSKTEILGFELLIILSILMKVKFIKNLVPVCSKVITKLYIVIPILSLLLVLGYPFGGVMKTIDKAMSGRLSVQSKVISAGNIKPFGSNIKMVGYGLEDSLKYDVNKEYNYIDNDYIQILVINGVVIASLLVILLYLLLLQLNEEKKYCDILYIYIYLLLGLINPRIIELMYSPVLFFIVPTLFNNQIKEIDERVVQEK